MTFGERVRSRREEARLSRAELGALTGINPVQLVNYENNTNQPTARVIIALAKALNVTSDWLLGVHIVGEDGLTDLEREALAVFRSKHPEQQPDLIQIMRLSK